MILRNSTFPKAQRTQEFSAFARLNCRNSYSKLSSNWLQAVTKLLQFIGKLWKQQLSICQMSQNYISSNINCFQLGIFINQSQANQVFKAILTHWKGRQWSSPIKTPHKGTVWRDQNFSWNRDFFCRLNVPKPISKLLFWNRICWNRNIQIIS